MAKIFLLTGLSGAGKTTLARALYKKLSDDGQKCVVLDGDEMRGGICKDLGFSPEDRKENIRRSGEIARLLHSQGITVIMAFIAPYESLRQDLAAIVGKENLRVIHISCPLEECKRRDPKNNYKKALGGQIKDYTGIEDRYENPHSPDLILRTDIEDTDKCLCKFHDFVQKQLDQN